MKEYRARFNWVWQYLNTNIAKLAAKLKPYLGGSAALPYKVYTAYISVDGTTDTMYAYREFENTIGTITFSTAGIGSYIITLPVSVPRRSIVIPGFGDYWGANNVIRMSGPDTGPTLTMYAGIDGGEDSNTNYIEIDCYDYTTSTSLTWGQYFTTGTNNASTAFPIEIRIYPTA
jgi:hypothetical protein